MSEVITDFAQPLIERVQSDEQYRKAIGIAVLIWNIALESEDRQEKLLSEVIRDLAAETGNDPEVSDYFETLGRTLLLRKRSLYSDNRRAILDYQITEDGDDLHLQVASTIIDEPA